MLEQLKIGNILFLDIETVPAYPVFQEAPDQIRTLWEKKSMYLRREEETPEDLYQRAGIYSEFGRIVCISTGMIGVHEDRRVFRIKSFYNPVEKELLESFTSLLNRLSQKREIELCAHNGKEFDFPYIARRMVINGVGLPELLDIAGKKPWEVKHLDTLDLWKFGDHKHYTSLNLLAAVFGLESPKSDLDGSQVAHVYWHEQDLARIVDYCRHDVITTAQIMLKFKGQEILAPEDLIVLDEH